MTLGEAEAKLLSELQRLKAYFPFRICWGAIHPETLEVLTGASTTRHRLNQLTREGWQGYEHVA